MSAHLSSWSVGIVAALPSGSYSGWEWYGTAIMGHIIFELLGLGNPLHLIRKANCYVVNFMRIIGPLLTQIGELPQCFTPHRFGAKIGTFFEAKVRSSARFKRPKTGRSRRPTDRPTDRPGPP